MPPSAKRGESMRGWLIAPIAVAAALLFARAVVPYVWVPNSIPGQAELSKQERFALLNEAVPRADPVAGRERVLRGFAMRETDGLARNERSGGTRLCQTLLAGLLLNRETDRCNRILNELVVWGRAGSSWAGHPKGDYDFALIWLTALLYEFGEDEQVLYPETRNYLLNTLLTEEGRLNRMVPRSGGMVFETENHLLMREGSRYLKNQWLKRQGPVAARFDNDRNGLGEWLESYLNHLRLHGVYEFNSTPYAVYTLLPLMNLADYAESATIRRLAEAIIDNIARRYAYGSYRLRQCAPFRRQFKYADNESLLLNRMAPMIRSQLDGTTSGNDLLVFASTFHEYRLPLRTLERFSGNNREEYFVRFAHEADGGEEIYSGGPGYLLSAGGVYRGESAKVIARPIALLLEDDAEKLDDCIHIRGIGDWKQWNMTGVHRRLAVARGTLHLPAGIGGSIAPGWNAFRMNDEVSVACYQQGNLAMLVVLPASELALDDALQRIKAVNPNPEKTGRFFWPRELAPTDVRDMAFDIDAPHQLEAGWH